MLATTRISGHSVRNGDVATAWYVLVVSSEVDVTLVQETLALTPQQRIQQNDRVLRMIEELRDGVAKSRKPARDTSDERR
jgi:type II secretory pathway component PulK